MPWIKVRVPRHTFNRLKDEAAERNMTLESYVRGLLAPQPLPTITVTRGLIPKGTTFPA